MPGQVKIRRSRLLEAETHTTGKAGRNLPIAVVSGLVLMGLLCLSLFWKQEIFVLLMTLFSVRAIFELTRSMSNNGQLVPAGPLLLGALLSPVSTYLWQETGILACGVITWIVYAIWSAAIYIQGEYKHCHSYLNTLGLGALCCAYVLLLGSTSILLVLRPFGAWLVLFAILLASSNDTGGWFFGILWGKHPLAPKISPKKTWEGLLGSLVAVMIMAVPGVWIIPNMPWWTLAIFIPGSVIAGTFGDLSESIIKRDLGVKDMGHIFPGHGGLIDRVDAILFVIPVVYVVSILVDLAAK